MKRTEAVTVVVPRVPPSPNKMMRMHWAARTRLWRTWRTEVLCCSTREQSAQLHKWAEKRMLISIHQKRKKFLDHDNLYGSVKPILDACKQIGWCRDDSPEWLCLQSVTQEIGKPETRITLWPCPKK